MEVLVTARPHMLFETVELMYAYVNEIPAWTLTEAGPYCLPVEAVQQMMDTACAEVSKQDPRVQYYFRRYQLSEEPERFTCIARNLAYNAMFPSTGSIAGDCEQLCTLRRQQRKNGDRFTAIDEYRLLYMEASESEFVPLAQDIARLGVSPEYGQMLLEQFSGFDEAVSQLEAILTPVANKLEPLMLPWAERAELLAAAWQEHYSQPDSVQKWQKRVRYTEELSLGAIQAQLRYLGPKRALGTVNRFGNMVFFHIGVAVLVEKPASESFEGWEFQALRLLGSEPRMRMLRVMMDKPMSSRELAQMLDLHLGVVCRDVGNLFTAKLLNTEMVNGRNRYRTNMETLNILAKHLIELGKFEPF